MAVKSLKRSSVKSTQKTNAMLAGYNFQDYELIESVFVSSSIASVSFNNLNQYATEYSHLQVRLVARTNRNDAGDSIGFRFNGDSASNYAWHLLYGNGSSALAFAATSTDRISAFRATGGNDVADSFGAIVLDILDSYNTFKNKTIRSFGGSSSTYREVVLGSGHWRSLDPISSIQMIGNNGNIQPGSRFSLYGIR
jgi:hypothetical protein